MTEINKIGVTYQNKALDNKKKYSDSPFIKHGTANIDAHAFKCKCPLTNDI